MKQKKSENQARRWANLAMAICLAVMAVSVFLNVILRYGFGSGIAASEELSRLLFVWMVFIGATAAYPAGEHMAFTTLIELTRNKPRWQRVCTMMIRVLVILACVMLGHGAWQQVMVGMNSVSVVLAYPTALLPLPVLLCAIGIGLMAFKELWRGEPLNLSHTADME